VVWVARVAHDRFDPIYKGLSMTKFFDKNGFSLYLFEVSATMMSSGICKKFYVLAAGYGDVEQKMRAHYGEMMSTILITQMTRLEGDLVLRKADIE
jgi:hypothetical protein